MADHLFRAFILLVAAFVYRQLLSVTIYIEMQIMFLLGKQRTTHKYKFIDTKIYDIIE